MRNNRLFRYLKSGGLIIYPTESCFGIGCDPSNIRAIRKIITLKKRNIDKNFILISSCIDNASSFIQPLNNKKLYQAQKKWPGAHTWLIESKINCPNWLKKNDTVALRIPSFKPCYDLCRSLDIPIISTSANISGKKSIKKYREAYRQFHKKSKIIKGVIGKNQKPSTIQDLNTGKIIRP